jgi:S1-C subfamily serine protease
VKEETPRSDAEAKTETTQTNETPTPLPARRHQSGDEIYRRLVKSCVYIRTPEALGSGSLIHKQRKLILTNYHVVGERAEVSVSFPGYDRFGKLIVERDFYELAYKRKELIRGKILRVAKAQDLALVELDTVPEGTPALKLATRSASPGQAVHSVGNPGASEACWLYTSGTVRQLSHKTWRARGARKIHSFDADVLETQSPTNPGDSGGPLVNDTLQLVGVTQGYDVIARELSFFIDVGEVKKLLQSCGVDLREVTGSTVAAEGELMDTADIFALIKCLEHRDARVRIESAHRLAELGPQAQPAAGSLIKALHDKEALVRQSAALALGRLGPNARMEVRKAVFETIRDNDVSVRLAAFEALANLGAPEPNELPTLLSMLHGAIERHQLHSCAPIARSLALLGSRARDAVPDLRELVKTEDRSVRIAALLALGKIGSAARDAIPELSETLKDSDRGIRIQTALALTAIDPTLHGVGKNALQVLVQCLRPLSLDESEGVEAKTHNKEVSIALVKIGGPAVEPLLKAIKVEFRVGRGRKEAGHLDALAREAALKIIGEIGPGAHSSQTLAALAELLRTEKHPAVLEAARHAYIAVQESK